MRGARFGFLGHTYPGMLDMYSDFTQHHAQVGSHVEVLEMCDLQARVQAATPAQIASKLGAGLILGNSLLTARGIPASGEGDLKNAVAMKIMDVLGAGGSFTEFYAMDFADNFVLMGHDGPAHLAISGRKPTLRGLELYHGKAGSGISVEFTVKTGPITILTCTQTREGKLKFMAAQGECIPGPLMRIGNTNSRLRFSLSPAEFVDAWCAEAPTHHCALGVGHTAGILKKFAKLKGLSFVEVGAL